MATKAQMNANRENARKSTGPRTPEGKTISSRNSLVHGMTSGKFLPPDTDPNEFFQLLDQYREHFQPVDQVEDALVERLAAAEFKMRSVRYLDAGLFNFQARDNPMPQQHDKAGRANPLARYFYSDAKHVNCFSTLARYEGHLQRESSRALRELYLVQDKRRARLAEVEAENEAEVEAENEAEVEAENEAEVAAEAARSEAAAGEPETPPATRQTKKTNRTQFPPIRDTPDGGWVRDARQNPGRNPLDDGTGGPPGP
jgi:hypothetical protein